MAHYNIKDDEDLAWEESKKFIDAYLNCWKARARNAILAEWYPQFKGMVHAGELPKLTVGANDDVQRVINETMRKELEPGAGNK